MPVRSAARANFDRKVTDPAYLAAFEAERARVLRRRMVWCLSILLFLLAISVLGIYFEYIEYTEGKTPQEVFVLGALQDLSVGALLIATLLYVLSGKPDRRRLVRAITISTIVTMLFATYFEVRRAIIHQTDFWGDPMTYPVDPRLWGCRWGLYSHALLVAIPLIIIPMHWRESLRVTLGCAACYLFLILIFADAPGPMAVAHTTLALLLPLAPMAYSHWRYLRFDALFQHMDLKDRYGALSAELSRARSFHESLFPAPIHDGPVRIGFVYEPMREIGGDLLFVRVPENSDREPIYLVLIDVSGHGVAAALAVNRLHGELLRIFGAARNRTAPTAGEIIADLNSYVFLTLAPQGVFATAICLKIEPGQASDEGDAGGGGRGGGGVEWCNAGHPPAMLRSNAGMIHKLGPTATMLGVLEPEVYGVEVRRVLTIPGDTLIAYTDGLPETRDPDGREFGLERVEEVLQAAARAEHDPRRIAELLAQTAAAHRAEAGVTDDTLVVEVWVAGRSARVEAVPEVASH